MLIIGVSFEINSRSGTSIPPSTPEMDVSPMILSMLYSIGVNSALGGSDPPPVLRCSLLFLAMRFLFSLDFDFANEMRIHLRIKDGFCNQAFPCKQ